MKNQRSAAYEESLLDYVFTSRTDARVSIAVRLILSFLLVIFVTSVVFIVVGSHLIADRVVAEGQQKVRYDLNAAREIYEGELNHIDDVIRLTADRFFLEKALSSGSKDVAIAELRRIRYQEGLDVLTVTDRSGTVFLRTTNLKQFGDDLSQDELVGAVLGRKEPVAGTVIIPADELRKESPGLVEKACCEFVDTPMARVRDETELTAGMMLKAAAPVFDQKNELVGTIYGGVLLNRNFAIVDRIKRTVYENLTYEGKDIGRATIFQNDVRISTNIKTDDGFRAIGTRVSEEVYNQVVQNGEPWIGRAFGVNDWYITAHGPLKNVDNEIIGIIGVGVLEQKYVDMKYRVLLTFLGITLMGVLGSAVLSYFLARRISVPIRRLVSASRELASGNLDARVEITSEDELGELAESFNAMASSLKERDEQLKEFARTKIMESQRLALIGQLSANVAHELNNPLQGIVTYSHLLLEREPSENGSTRESLQRIVYQATRCRDIIRGLLDFSRQRKPDKALSDINHVLEECLALVEPQALFHDIEIVKQFGEGLPMIVVDPSQMERVFMNMIINAAEAMPDGGRLTVATRFDAADEFIEVEFTDTGHGISEEDMERLFDPFFTTKEVGHGVGLGLAISYGIVKEHKGSISVESEVGEGTIFVIRLPLITEEKGEPESERAVAERSEGAV